MMAANDNRHFMASVKIGPKGQIVIPKEVRDMFGFEPGDMLVLLADTKRGVALQTMEKLSPFLRKTFDTLSPEADGEDEGDASTGAGAGIAAGAGGGAPETAPESATAPKASAE